MNNPAVKPISAINEQILTALKADQTGDRRYLGLCPAHDDKHPSLVIYENADGFLGFNCNSRRCAQTAIVNAIKEKHGIVVPSRNRSGSKGLDRVEVLYPSHIQEFPPRLRKPNDTVYEYTCSTGEIAFFVHRFPDDKGGKQIVPYFSKAFYSTDGSAEKLLESKDPPRKKRPLYNLHLLAQFPERPVLIVEGEKTADAAMRLPELSSYVITTWSGGTGNPKASDWNPLKDRNTSIYLWPDNDDSGIKAMKEIARRITQGKDDTRLFLLPMDHFYKERLDTGWDIADGFENQENSYSLEEMLREFQPYSTTEVIALGSIEEEMQKREARYRKLRMSGKPVVIDLELPRDAELFQYAWYRDLSALLAFDVDKVASDDGKYVRLAKQWYENYGIENTLDGIKFDPTTTSKELNYNGSRYLNTFTGFPNIQGNTADTRLAEFFIAHLKGLLEEPKLLDWIVDYFAHIFQQPAEKPGVAIIFEGGQATGKTSIHRIVSSVLGHKLSKLMNKDMVAWNGFMTSSLLLVYEEFSVDMYKEKWYYDYLKDVITNTRIKIREKYVNELETDSYHRLIFTTNDAQALKLPNDDRRFVIVRTTKHWRDNLSHFKELEVLLKDQDALAGFKHWLCTRKITSDVTKAPMTIAKEEILHTKNRILDEILTWANGDGLPDYLRRALGAEVARQFGNIPILLSRRLMREYINRHGLKSYYFNTEIDMLRRVFPDKERAKEMKRRITLYGDRGEVSEYYDLVFVIPPLKELRANIEAEAGFKIKWVDIEDGEVDNTNVVEMAKRETLF